MNPAQEEALRVMIAREGEKEQAAAYVTESLKTYERRKHEWDDARRAARELGVVINSTS